MGINKKDDEGDHSQVDIMAELGFKPVDDPETQKRLDQERERVARNEHPFGRVGIKQFARNENVEKFGDFELHMRVCLQCQAVFTAQRELAIRLEGREKREQIAGVLAKNERAEINPGLRDDTFFRDMDEAMADWTREQGIELKPLSDEDKAELLAREDNAWDKEAEKSELGRFRQALPDLLYLVDSIAESKLGFNSDGKVHECDRLELIKFYFEHVVSEIEQFASERGLNLMEVKDKVYSYMCSCYLLADSGGLDGEILSEALRKDRDGFEKLLTDRGVSNEKLKAEYWACYDLLKILKNLKSEQS